MNDQQSKSVQKQIQLKEISLQLGRYIGRIFPISYIYRFFSSK